MNITSLDENDRDIKRCVTLFSNGDEKWIEVVLSRTCKFWLLPGPFLIFWLYVFGSVRTALRIHATDRYHWLAVFSSNKRISNFGEQVFSTRASNA